MSDIKILDAAWLLSNAEQSPELFDFADTLDEGGVQAKMTAHGILIIQGTNQGRDWIDFNLDVFDLTDAELGNITLVDRSDVRNWHAGFLEYAEVVYGFANRFQVKLILGHSLGGAAAQIIGAKLQVPTLAFATPRTYRGNGAVPGSQYVLNVLKSNDRVCNVPPSFKHVGTTIMLEPIRRVNFGEDHRIRHYIRVLEQSPTYAPRRDVLLSEAVRNPGLYA